VSAIVVHHHTPDLLAACIESLARGSRTPDEIIVVDNAVAPGSASPAWDVPMPVRVLAHEANPGYAASCNVGARAASGDVLLFLNADVSLSPSCLERCLESLAGDPEIGIATCRLRRLDGSLDHACHRGIPTPSASMAYLLRLDRLAPRSRRLGRYRMTWLDPETDHDVEACTGAFMLIPRDALDAAGGWDERYWFYGEDLDLCVRIRQLGRRVRYLGSATATHVKGASSHLRESDELLDPDERRLKRQVRAAILDSHELFFRQHLAPRASMVERTAARILFALQRKRLELRLRPDAG
jgi:GT2 family glycosyltransferase